MYPSGTVVKKGELKFETASEVIEHVGELTGYIAFTVKDKTGVQDASVALAKGKVKGAFFEHFKTKEKITGEQALEKIKSLQSHQGVYDVVSLSEEQVNLSIAVRPESEVKLEKEEKQVETSEEILKKYGLSSLVHNV